jgi:hypothetical protein
VRTLHIYRVLYILERKKTKQKKGGRKNRELGVVTEILRHHHPSMTVTQLIVLV